VAQEKLGKQNDDLVRAMDAFGGGLAAHGEVCGLVAGGLAAIGLLFGRAEGNREADMNMWMYSREFLKRFQKGIAGGSLLCRDIVAVDWTDMNQVTEYRMGEKHLKCKALTGETARLIGDLMERAVTAGGPPR
jgi:C_GCAxxG_C_C family probable redox protein